LPGWPLYVQVRSVVSFSFLDDFCKRKLPEQWGVQEKQRLLAQFVGAWQEQRYTQDHLEKILQVGVRACARARVCLHALGWSCAVTNVAKRRTIWWGCCTHVWAHVCMCVWDCDRLVKS